MADIAQLGYQVDSSQLTRATTELGKHTAAAQKTEAATVKFEKKVDQLALSQKQLIAAQRQLPMQFTDIFVGLQSGQSPMQVLIQHGGQLKDIFGGVGPALRAAGGYILSLINPLTLAAGAVGLFAVAWSQFEERQNSIDRALIRTGRFTEEYAARLRDLSTEMDDIAGVTAGSASKAIAQVASTGRFSGEQLETVARAAETWRAATGDAVEDVVKDFAKLKGDPIKAALELNRTYGFLTQSVLDQAEALVEQGRETDATNLLVNSLADTLERRAPQMSEQVGSIAAAFRGMGRAATETWDSVVEGMDEAFDQGVRTLAGLPGLAQGFGSFLRVMQDEGRRTGGGAAGGPTEPIVDSDEIEAARKATEKWQRITLANLSKEEKLEREIAEIRKAGAAANRAEAEIEAAITAARDRYNESLRKGSRLRKETDPTEAIIKRLQDQIALNEAQAGSEEKLTATERMLVQVRTDLERIGEKGSATNKALIQQLIEQARATDAAAEAAERKRIADEALLRLQERVALSEANRRRGNEIDLLGLEGGGEAAQMLRRQLDIHRWYEDQVSQLRRQAAIEKRDVTAEEEQVLQDSLQRQLEDERRFQQQRQALMGDWRVGANRALQNYLEYSRDIASQVEDIWAETFATFEDIGTDALTGNLKSWGEYFDNIHAMIARFIVRQQLSGWMQSVLGGGGESDAGSLLDLFGSFGSGGFFGGGRAWGGDVRGDRMYQVGERNRPELANIGGRQYLIPGDRGNIEPIRSTGGGARPIQVTQNFYTEGRIDPRTASQQQQDAAVKLRTATARNS